MSDAATNNLNTDSDHEGHLAPITDTSKQICNTRRRHPRRGFRSWASAKHRQCQGSSGSGRFTTEWWTSMLKTNNTPMVNSGNQQTPAAKHLLLVAFGAQAMVSAISRVCRNAQHLHENNIFHDFQRFFVKVARPQIPSPHTKTTQQQMNPNLVALKTQ